MTRIDITDNWIIGRTWHDSRAASIPCLNKNAAGIYINAVLIEIGIFNSRYYVRSVETNRFKIATANDDLTIVDLTTNATMDLTKWHFEVVETMPASITITGLPARQAYSLQSESNCYWNIWSDYNSGCCSVEKRKLGNTRYNFQNRSKQFSIISRYDIGLCY